jgi:methionyl-tRNA formyltransferase
MMTNQMNPNCTFAFFGTSHIARNVLEELARAGYVPSRIITAPDRPQGRGLALVASDVSVWADDQGILTEKPEKITSEWVEHFARTSWDLCIVADYGLILPKTLLEVPKHGFLNMHPSLLPRLRGPSPIRSAILTDERDTGVSVMLVDAKMDHGPVIAQEHVAVPEWPPRAHTLDDVLSHSGGRLLASVLPGWVAGTVDARKQDHTQATFSKMFTKADGLIDLADDPYQNLLKIRAFETWPGTYTFFMRGTTKIRVSITGAHLNTDGTLVIDRVIPEGKKEMDYKAFLLSGATPLATTRLE